MDAIPVTELSDTRGAGMRDALQRAGRERGAAFNIQEESAMTRSITLSLTLAVALASQVALGGCSKKEDVNNPPADTSTSAASAPDTSASSTMGASSTPMDSISSASAVAGSDAASAAAQAASDSAMAASK